MQAWWAGWLVLRLAHAVVCFRSGRASVPLTLKNGCQCYNVQCNAFVVCMSDTHIHFSSHTYIYMTACLRHHHLHRQHGLQGRHSHCLPMPCAPREDHLRVSEGEGLVAGMGRL